METEKNYNFNSVNLEAGFIKKYLGYTKSDFITVYIFAKSVDSPTVSSVSEGLELSFAAVYNAVLFWKEEGLLQEKDGEITFCENVKPKKAFQFDERPEYDPMELTMYAKNNPEVKTLFEMTQKYLGRLLTHNDLSGIFSIYTWVGLSIPVIDKLLEYCSENNHRNMRYIERVAIDWAENGIDTPEAAEEKIKMYNTDFRRILRAMGQGGRNPVPKEEKYMTTWIKDFKLPIEVIEMACEKTVLNTGKASFGYANKILSSWKEYDVRNCDEALALEAKYIDDRKKETPVASIKPQPSASRKNKFVNFDQREYNFEEYERRELERISKKEQ